MNPIPEKIRKTANEIAVKLHSALPPGIGFALLLFDLGEGGNMSYISDAERVSMIAAMKELIQNMEKEP